jgi:hypothetical protein
MAINKFIFILLGCSIIFLMVDTKSEVVKKTKYEKPIVSFYDSIMYDINSKNVNKIIQSKEAYFYKEMEELVDGTIITRTQNESTNMVSGSNMIKIKDDIYIDGNVHFLMGNSADLKTEQLEYNTKTKIAKNVVPFTMIKDDDIFIGRDLYLNGNTKHIIAKNIKIKIRMTDDKN